MRLNIPDCKVHGANTGPTWVLSAPSAPHVGPMNLAIRIPKNIAELIRDQAPVSLTFFHRNSNSMEISFHSHLDSNTLIAIKFCIWRDSSVVLACAKIAAIWWSVTEVQDGKVSVELRLWEKSLVKRIPDLNMFQMCLWLMGRKKNTNLNTFSVHFYTIFCSYSRSNLVYSLMNDHESSWQDVGAVFSGLSFMYVKFPICILAWQGIELQPWNINCMMTSLNGNIFRVTALWMGNSPVTCEFRSQRPTT